MKSFGRCIKRVAAIGMSVVMLFSFPQRLVQAGSTDKISISMIGKYDSADTAAIRSIDTDKKQIRFRNHSTGKTYTLSYDNTSMIYDVRGTALSAQLLEAGQVVDVTFLKSTKHITTLRVSGEAWTIDSTRDHELVRNDGTARVKGEMYRLDARTLVLADGEVALAENVLSTDKIKVSGIGKEIYSVVVTSGHGYVSLSSETVEDQSLVGAWIELDNDVIYKISPNMLLSAPEGDYNLQILGNGANYQSEISITRNQETVVDTSDITITKPKEGLVTFEITPEDAEVFVDGKKLITGIPQSVQYGYHNLKIMADGYITQNRYLKVGTAKSVVRIELEKEEDSSESAASGSFSTSAGSVSNSTAKTSIGKSYADVASSKKSTASSASSASTVSSNSSTSSTAANQVISGYYIYFDEPDSAELYFDGSYIGVVPTRVPKISGSHEVILKRDGYKTKSYRIKIDTSEADIIYEFPDMEKNDDDNSSSSSGTTSAASGSTSSDASKSEGTGSSSLASTKGTDEEDTSADATTEVTDGDVTGKSLTEDSNDLEESSSAATGKTTDDSEEAGDIASTASGED